jgi:hypothetical protein
VWHNYPTSAAKVKKTSRMTNLMNNFKKDCINATFNLNSEKFEYMGPVYAKVQQTVASMTVSLETIKKDHNDQVPNDQIVSMSSILEVLTTRVKDCMIKLDKKALDSTVVYGDQAEYADEATAGDNTENVSSIGLGGDWDIFCLERSIQPDGKIYTAMYDISPLWNFPAMCHQSCT